MKSTFKMIYNICLEKMSTEDLKMFKAIIQCFD